MAAAKQVACDRAERWWAAPAFAAMAARMSSRRPLVLLTLLYVLNFVDRQLVGILGQPIKADLGLSDAAIGLLSGAAFALFYTALGLPMARLAERRSRVGLIAAGMALWSAMTMLCGLARGLPLFALARLGVGVGEAGYAPAAQSLLADYVPAERRATALSLFSLGVPLGMMIAAIGGGWLAEALGWRMAFVLLGLPGLVLAALLPRLLREPARGAMDPAAAGDAPAVRAVAALLWRAPGFRHMAAGAAISSFAGYALTSFAVQLLMRGYHLSLGAAATGFGLVAGGSIGIGIAAGGWLADRRPRSGAIGRVALAGALMAGLLFSFVLGLPNPWLLAIGGIAPLIGAHLYLGPTYGLTVNSVPASARATAIALLLILVNGVGLGLGPPVIGALSDHFASICGPRCHNPQAYGLSIALRIDVLLYFYAALHFALARRDLKLAQPQSAAR